MRVIDTHTLARECAIFCMNSDSVESAPFAYGHVRYASIVVLKSAFGVKGFCSSSRRQDAFYSPSTHMHRLFPLICFVICASPLRAGVFCESLLSEATSYFTRIAGDGGSTRSTPADGNPDEL